MTAFNTDEQQLLAAILAAPADDALRLAYADWLTEHGRPERGEFIQLQCETAKRGLDQPINSSPTHYCLHCNALWVLWPKDGGWSLCSEACGKCCDNAQMKEQIIPLPAPVVTAFKRMAELMACGWADGWWGPTTDRPGHSLGPNSVYWENGGRLVAIVTSRGFLSEIRCTAGTLVNEASPNYVRPIFQDNPVERVLITDKTPYWNSRVIRTYWFDSNGTGDGHHVDSDLPDALYNLLPDGGSHRSLYAEYATIADARAALMAACLRYGRSLIGPATPEA